MPITRTPMIDDDGTGTTGTIFNNAWKQELYDQIDGAVVNGPFITVSDTGEIGDYVPAGFDGATRVIYWTGTSALTIHGLNGGVNAQIVTFRNLSPNGSILWFLHESVGASTLNRFQNVATSAPTAIAAGGSMTFHLNLVLPRWFQLDHEQGAWITPPFNAADYGGWAVSAGHVALARYRLTGRTLQWALNVSAAPLAAPGTVSRAIFGGFTVAMTGASVLHGFVDATGPGTGIGQYGGTLTFYRDGNGAPFAAGTLIMGAMGMVEVN